MADRLPRSYEIIYVFFYAWYFFIETTCSKLAPSTQSLPACIGLHLIQSKHHLIHTPGISFRRVTVRCLQICAERFVWRCIYRRYSSKPENIFFQMDQCVKLYRTLSECAASQKIVHTLVF